MREKGDSPHFCGYPFFRIVETHFQSTILKSDNCPLMKLFYKQFLSSSKKQIVNLIKDASFQFVININTAIALMMNGAYIINTRYCDARIESILLEVNKKEVKESLW